MQKHYGDHIPARLEVEPIQYDCQRNQIEHVPAEGRIVMAHQRKMPGRVDDTQDQGGRQRMKPFEKAREREAAAAWLLVAAGQGGGRDQKRPGMANVRRKYNAIIRGA